MTEVTSTSHSAILDGAQKKSTTAAFDVRSWQGLTEVLKVARESGLPAEEYAEFRDLVLQYAQRGGDVELRKKIDNALLLFTKQKRMPPQNLPQSDVVPDWVRSTDDIAKEISATPAEEVTAVGKTPERPTPSAPHRPTFGRRPVPSFLPRHVVDTATGEVLEGGDPSPVIPVERTETMLREPVASDPKEGWQTEPVLAVQNETAHETQSVPASADGAPLPYDVSDERVEAPLPKPFRTLEEHKARIAEIKRSVNGLVGNPVTLMGAENQIGRTYMTALLTAMKAATPGAQGVDEAMERLESAYKAIQDLSEKRMAAPVVEMESPSQVSVEPQASEVVSSQPTSEPVMPADDTVVASEDVYTRNVPVESIDSTPVRASRNSVPLTDESKPNSDLQTKDERLEYAVQHAMNASREAALLAYVEAEDSHNNPGTSVSEVVEPQSVVSEESVITQQPEHDATPKSRFSLSALLGRENKHQEATTPVPTFVPLDTKTADTAVPVHTRVEPGVDAEADAGRSEFLPTIEPSSIPVEQIAVRQTELASPEVTVALVQLLGEWQVFASSGLFGIGPGGVEHPLYQKLAKLSMGEVIAGRWENADPKVARTIKDYVDAWRHEQGIAYSPTETFEHYLRRVIQRILKRQKGEMVA